VIQWSTAATGEQVIPVLLIAGMPAIFYPDGVTVTSVSIASPDSAWWPGSSWSAYAKPWLQLAGDGLRFSERAIPSASQVLDVSEITVNLSDVDLGATALFASEGSAVATYITATVSATDTTINVVSTSAFASSGTIYLDQEAISYTGKTASSFTGCTRGRYGSKATRHLYAAALGTGLGNPQVTDRVVETVGRPATMWLCRIVGGVIVEADLQHYGTIGTGPALQGGGESFDDGWVLHIDHAVKRLGQKIHAQTISVGGYAHPGNFNARGTGSMPADNDLTPFFFCFSTTVGGSPNTLMLTGDDAAPDLGGWHPSREAFVQALNGMPSPLGTFSAQLNGNGRLIVRFDSTPSRNYFYYVKASCTTNPLITNYDTSANNRFYGDFGAMAEAWVPIVQDSPVYVSASDYASVPPTTGTLGAYYALIFGDDNDRSTRRVARITGQGTSGSAYFLTCTAIPTGQGLRTASISSSDSSTIASAALWRAGRSGGFIATNNTTARLGFYVESPSWVTALQTVVNSLAFEYASVADAIDWTRIAEVAAAYPSPITARRAYVVDLNTSVLSILQNEAALNGFALVMYRGRVSITRVAEFCATESTTDTITTADLDARAPSPTYEKGADGIVNTYTVVSPDDGVTVNVTDATSQARYGTQGTITATMPRSLLNVPSDGGRLYAQVFAQAVSVLGPLRYPYRHVGITLPLNHYGLQVGDLCTVTLWRVPDGLGGRGITDAVAQVVSRDVVLYSDAGEGHAAYTLRLNPSGIAGYAPAGLVAAGGISGGTVTLDVTTIAGGLTGGGNDAAPFATGDLVRLVEIDSTSPTTSTQHTVTATGTNTLTLSPAPSATFSTLAASALKVAVVFDSWTVLTAGSRDQQERYCFLGKADQTLDATHVARVFAA
jgi:hypothetical protein